MGKKIILEIENLKVSFRNPRHSERRIEAVKGVSLTLEEGSFTALVGESGSGKSVTSLSITRLAMPYEESGKIIWQPGDERKAILALTEKELLKIRGSEISYVFQDPASSLNPVLRVGRQIAETYRAHFDADAPAAKRRALELLSDVQMKDAQRVYESFPHELSGGMRQRAMIAMALIAAPRLLIADEPTTALDAEVESEIMSLLLKIREERKLTVLFITHDMGCAASYSDVIYVMKNGTVVERLDREIGIFLPKNDYTKKLFSMDVWDSPPKTMLGG